jgi:CO/xanthine dehydrogenase Mo-binding subunit
MMGMGYALLEELEVEEGRIKNAGFSNYLIYTALDLPNIHPVILEEGDPVGPFGAKGIGEPALIPTAPAIIAAVRNATGAKFNNLPVTQERVMEQIVANQGERSKPDDNPSY